MAVCLSPKEQTIALQSFANLVPGDRYYVLLANGRDFVAWLAGQRGPDMCFHDGEREHNLTRLEIEEVQRL